MTRSKVNCKQNPLIFHWMMQSLNQWTTPPPHWKKKILCPASVRIGITPNKSIGHLSIALHLGFYANLMHNLKGQMQLPHSDYKPSILIHKYVHVILLISKQCFCYIFTFTTGHERSEPTWMRDLKDLADASK